MLHHAHHRLPLRIFVNRMLYYICSVVTLLRNIDNWPLVIAVFLGLRVATPFTIRLRGSGLQFKVCTPMDIWIIKETCIDRGYDLADWRITDGWQIIDVGAALGDFSIDVAVRHSGTIVHAYEPFPQSFTLLQENLRLNHARNVTAFHEALAGRDGQVNLDVSAGVSVLHSTATDAVAGVMVPSVSLATALARLPGKTCDLLKLDCEGAEYDIVFNAEALTLQRIDRIVMEYHNRVVEYSGVDMASYLRTHGFVVWQYPSRVQPNTGLLYASRTGERARVP